MINFGKIIKPLRDKNFGLRLPSKHVQNLIDKYPESRVDPTLKNDFYLLQLPTNVSRLSNSERILLAKLKLKDKYEQRVNEISHLLFITKQEDQLSYFLNDLDLLNPPDCKMGDIYVPVKNKKYEVKSYDKLEIVKAKKLVAQYSENNFKENEIYFNILFNEIKCRPEEYSEYLSKNLNVSINSITLISTKELQDEINVETLINKYYNIPYLKFEEEYEKYLWLQIYNCNKNTIYKNTDIGTQLSDLIRAHKNKGLTKNKTTKQTLTKLKLPKFDENLDSDVIIDNTINNDDDINNVD